MTNLNLTDSVPESKKNLDDRLSAKELRKLSREERSAHIYKMSEISIPISNKYKNELFVDETGDGIE
jgi:hypothetical protein